MFNKNKKRPGDTNLPYKIIKPILIGIFKLYCNPKSINKGDIPKKGPVLICGNHLHMLDQCMAVMHTNRVVHYMAKKEYFDGKFAWFFKAAGCISVDRSIKDEAAKNEAIRILENGGVIGIFPEGTRNKTKDQLLLPFKFGAVSMAKKTDATIVPFGAIGDYKFRSKNLKMKFGKPFKVTDMELEEANEKLYNTIKELVLDLKKENNDK